MNGFSLVELMVTVAILGVVAAISVPSYQNYINETYLAQASSDLKRCAMALERYYSQDFTYVGAGDEDTSDGICEENSPPEGETRFVIMYDEINARGFQLVATPVGGSCGNGDCLVLDHLGNMSEN